MPKHEHTSAMVLCMNTLRFSIPIQYHVSPGGLQNPVPITFSMQSAENKN